MLHVLNNLKYSNFACIVIQIYDRGLVKNLKVEGGGRILTSPPIFFLNPAAWRDLAKIQDVFTIIRNVGPPPPIFYANLTPSSLKRQWKVQMAARDISPNTFPDLINCTDIERFINIPIRLVHFHNLGAILTCHRCTFISLDIFTIFGGGGEGRKIKRITLTI